MAATLIAGIAIGWLTHHKVDRDDRLVRLRDLEFRSIEKPSTELTFINPLLQCDESQDYFNELRPFKAELEVFIEKLYAEGLAKEIAIYFRDLNNGPWIGINEKDDFQPASLTKVPLMMGVLKLAEKDPALLDRKVKYDGPMNLHQNMPKGAGLQAGKKYTIREILYSLIIYSDNRAVWILDKLFDQKALRDPVFCELGIPTLEDSPDMEISMKNYASFFRVLYNASYLSRDMSDLALQMLSTADMNDALVGGVPQSVVVAHKFGRMNRDRAHPQMHDCGIVYYPAHPYLLCVMTKGDDTEKLTRAIREISGFVYSSVNAQLMENGEFGSKDGN